MLHQGLDTDKDGRVSKKELESGIALLCGHGHGDEVEFCTWVGPLTKLRQRGEECPLSGEVDMRVFLNEDQLKFIFNLYDSNGDGELDIDEIVFPLFFSFK